MSKEEVRELDPTIVQPSHTHRPTSDDTETSTHVANAVGGLPIAVPSQILLHGHHGRSMLFGRHDGLVAHYAGRWVLGAHG